jgi:hypothetical protein
MKFCVRDLRGLNLTEGSSLNLSILQFVSNQIKKIKKEGDQIIACKAAHLQSRSCLWETVGCQEQDGSTVTG